MGTRISNVEYNKAMETLKHIQETEEMNRIFNVQTNIPQLYRFINEIGIRNSGIGRLFNIVDFRINEQTFSIK